MSEIRLREADRVEVTVLVDNYCDLFLEDTDRVKRLRVLPPAGPWGEPGAAFLVAVHSGDEKHTLLLDTGITPDCLLHNAGALANSMSVMLGAVGTALKDVETVVLSHGHFDHFGGLEGFLAWRGPGLEVVLHPEAFRERRARVNQELTVDLTSLDETAILEAGASIRRSQGPSTLAHDLILVSGEIPRRTEFEQGLPGMEAKIHGEWVTDPFNDDQGLAIQVKNRGLVVISGCAHAGIINTVRHLQDLTGVEHVHGVMGGFHLSGPNDPVVEPTIAAMQTIAPDVVVPMHCTGWKAIQRFAQAMPEQFILNSVGATYIFQ